MPFGSVTVSVHNEIRIAVVETKIIISHLRLLPADHAVTVISQDDHDQIHLQSDCRFNLLAVHHETAIAAHRDDGSIRMHKTRCHR
ncbi:hypothetical protein D9M73_280140 [compost metagenome]